jgi:D-alanyl-D-alanine dipeptidase
MIIKQLIVCIILLPFTAFNIIDVQDPLVNLESYSTQFSYDIRYATSNNFMNLPLYDCEVCLLQEAVANALNEANQYFCEKGYKIKIYDCYRPLDIQKQMWEKVPNAVYVANPYDGGSVHNRGAAVDITLVTIDDCFVDMGTEYDYFGREAHIDFEGHSESILNNRKLLSDGMKLFGFNTIQSEWWHFSFSKNTSFPIKNIPLPCNE